MDKSFQSRLRKLAEQSFGYPVYGIPTEEIPGQTVDDVNDDTSVGGGIVNGVVPDSTAQTTVTNGDTTPIDEPRSDVEASSTDGNQNEIEDAHAEISSLLITIGYILQSKGIVSDKFNTSEVVGYINTNFGQIQNALPAPQDELPQNGQEPEGIDVVDTEVEVDPTQAQPITADQAKAAYFEGRRLLESKRTKRANNKGSGKK